ncbi:tyrosine-type recombinase/integrase [Opitutus terrae]|uniref:Integrase family protein n=1 Tax=Opitutus terrae (strain DSM 11246 / JCM 15787 / PB90-1) TaxID=452637 RepID=B1ZRH5_OPITP|nr:tyrosine-type recombinase/integrase [Opitutus terrae]ACB77625.1 integrase family protein [Opitutus terrae PB90-1]
MALELRYPRSKWWYGRVAIGERRILKNLAVEVRGSVPPTLTELGDMAFERTRAKAQAALEKLQLDLKRRASAEELVQTIHEIRTGARVSSIPLAEIGARWCAVLRRRPLSASYQKQKVACIERFIRFAKKASPSLYEMAQVQAPLANAFCRAELARGVAAKTYNHTLIHLRSVFHVLRKEAGIAENPFATIPLQDGETVFRKPFSVEELSLLEEKAQADPFIYPLIVTGMCTAMRRGDCCTLRRSSVDLEGGFVTVKTAKTGETVQIPIFPLLRSVLEKALAKPAPRPPFYVFPELEAHYRLNPDHLTDRVRRVMKAAGFFNPKDNEDAPSRGAVQQEREHGLRKASLRDFHSLRVTWVTVALTAGVPLEIVQKVTGHRTTAIVLKHYFQPGREEFRRTLAGRLPALLGERSKPTSPPPEAFNVDELRAKLTAMEASTWRHTRDELLTRLPLEVKVTPPAKSLLEPSFAA